MKALSHFRTVSKNTNLLTALKFSVSYFVDSYIRPYAPTIDQSAAIRNISITKKAKFTDLFVPHKAYHEYLMCKLIEENTQRNDSVVVVGGGRGITATLEAKNVGSNGDVLIFEAFPEKSKKIKQVLSANSINAETNVRTAAVANKKPSNFPPKTILVDPSDLPRCDVLELDCEGAEIEIIDKLPFLPRDIYVETHGIYGTPRDDVINALERNRFEVVKSFDHIKKKGITILHGRSNS
ncbi:hypothetical protein [Halobellus sp. GM3]|uniref:hypothetical protein n=1 Tax=Halobellus sp. GM3 TaxID=3458410 RepID=UPI00403D6CFE